MATSKRFKCKFCGSPLPAWLPVAKRPESSMLLYHLGQQHLEEVRQYLQCMESECLDRVLGELFEVVEEDETR